MYVADWAVAETGPAARPIDSPTASTPIPHPRYLNALFVVARSIGLVGHALDQKRLQQPLYRHPWCARMCTRAAARGCTLVRNLAPWHLA